jgi:hypothetical protein
MAADDVPKVQDADPELIGQLQRLQEQVGAAAACSQKLASITSSSGSTPGKRLTAAQQEQQAQQQAGLQRHLRDAQQVLQQVSRGVTRHLWRHQVLVTQLRALAGCGAAGGRLVAGLVQQLAEALTATAGGCGEVMGTAARITCWLGKQQQSYLCRVYMGSDVQPLKKHLTCWQSGLMCDIVHGHMAGQHVVLTMCFLCPHLQHLSAAAAEDPALAAARGRALSAVGRLVRAAALVRERPGDVCALRSLLEVIEGEEQGLGALPEVRPLDWAGERGRVGSGGLVR